MKKELEMKDKRIGVRLTSRHEARIKWLAGQYAHGDMSLWITYCALNMARKRITKEDLK